MRCLRSLGMCSLAIALGALFAVGAPTAADPPVDELLGRVKAAAAPLQTLTADVYRAFPGAKVPRAGGGVSKGKDDEWTGTLEVERPNRLRLDLQEKGGPGHTIEIWDGHTKWYRNTVGNFFSLSAEGADTTVYFPGIGWPGYAEPSYVDLLGDVERTMHWTGQQTVDGVVCDVLEMTGWSQTVRWFVGPDNRVHRQEETTRDFSFSDPETLVLSHIQEGVPIADTDFSFDTGGARQMASVAYPPLIAIGHTVPQVDLPLASGGTLRLADVCRGKKAVLVFSINYPS